MGSGRAQVAGVDLTFTAPKSASVLYALGGPEVAACAAEAHRDAVSGAVAYLERHAVGAARSESGERIVIPTSGMVAGVFTHAVNRNHDPHLHSHVVMANLVHGADGRWGACDRRGLDAHRAAAGAVYAAHLRSGLRSALGVSWTRPMAGSAEVDGVESALRGEFSSRSADIRRHVAEMGSRTARGRRVAWAATRPAKLDSPPFPELAAEWARRARALGAAPLKLTRSAPSGREAVLDEHGFAATLSETPHGGAYRRDAVRAFATAARDGAPGAALERLTDLWLPPGGVGVAETMHRRRDVTPGGHLLGRWAHVRSIRTCTGCGGVRRRRSSATVNGWGLVRSPDVLGGGAQRRPFRWNSSSITYGRRAMSRRCGRASACDRFDGWSADADSATAPALGPAGRPLLGLAPAWAVLRGDEVTPGLLPMGRRQLHLGHRLVRTEHVRTSRMATGDRVHRQPRFGRPTASRRAGGGPTSPPSG